MKRLIVLLVGQWLAQLIIVAVLIGDGAIQFFNVDVSTPMRGIIAISFSIALGILFGGVAIRMPLPRHQSLA